MNQEDAIYLMLEREHEFKEELINLRAQPWTVIKAGMLKMEWQYCARVHQVHERLILKFEDICVNNVVKLGINSYIFGSQPISAYEFFEYDIPEYWDKEFFDEFIEGINFLDKEGDLRYSDHANGELQDCAINLLMEPIIEKKLWLIDNLLSVTHVSTDLASWFVEGGVETLNELKEWRESERLHRQVCYWQADRRMGSACSVG